MSIESTALAPASEIVRCSSSPHQATDVCTESRASLASLAPTPEKSEVLVSAGGIQKHATNLCHLKNTALNVLTGPHPDPPGCVDQVFYNVKIDSENKTSSKKAPTPKRLLHPQSSGGSDLLN